MSSVFTEAGVIAKRADDSVIEQYVGLSRGKNLDVCVTIHGEHFAIVGEVRFTPDEWREVERKLQIAK